MESTSNPVWDKIQSFLKFGGVSGDALEKIQESGIDTTRSYDSQKGLPLSLNCISKPIDIKGSLIRPANGGFGVAAEETVGDNGIFDEVLKRREVEIFNHHSFVRLLGLSNSVTLKSSSLKAIICKDSTFIKNLTEKLQRTALFVFELPIQKEDLSNLGCKETWRSNVSPENIKLVLIPRRYKKLIESVAESIPKKIVFVDDKKDDPNIGYKDENNDAISCVAKDILLPDYETHLNKFQSENLGKPFYTHMTRLPE